MSESIDNYYRYDAWGNVESSTGEMAQENSYLFTGREYDWQTGVYYYRARSYDANLGRFLQQDPAGMADGPNVYLYCSNDPVNRVDPSGMSNWKINEDEFSECVLDLSYEISYATILCLLGTISGTAVAVAAGAFAGGFAMAKASAGTSTVVSALAIVGFTTMLLACLTLSEALASGYSILKCGVKSLEMTAQGLSRTYAIQTTIPTAEGMPSSYSYPTPITLKPYVGTFYHPSEGWRQI